MKKIDGGVTAPKGFKAAGLYAGIKKGGKKDMAMVYSEVPCRAAGVFTTNVVKAAPVKWDHEVVYESEFAQAVVVNSGVANACTGIEGYNCCKEMAAEAGKVLGVPGDAVLVAEHAVMRTAEMRHEDRDYAFSGAHCFSASNALQAAICSASFFDLPLPSPVGTPLMSTRKVKSLL